jgi:phosphoribosylformylglycinamidine synthase
MNGALCDLFSAEAGVVVETPHAGLVMLTLDRFGVPAWRIGKVRGVSERIQITHGHTTVVDEAQEVLRSLWSETSSRIDEVQSNPEPIRAERRLISEPLPRPDWRLTYVPTPNLRRRGRYKVAVLRAPATNGEYEMAQSAIAAGFRVFDLNVEDLIAGSVDLRSYQGLLLPGGFSYGDIPDAAAALAAVLRFNPEAVRQLADFRKRPDTFGFGVCNGAQLMLRMGWAPGGDLSQPMWPQFVRNTVERHKSSFVTVEILPSRSLMFQGMEGSRLGVWVSHGEGRLKADDHVLELMKTQGHIPMRYVTPDGRPVEANDYPYNPSGTPHGWPAVCSGDGRFTAIMPHPERMANQLWQWPWLPQDWHELSASPWLQPFQNAYDWCVKLT